MSFWDHVNEKIDDFEKAMSRARCFEWHSHFMNGRTSLEHKERWADFPRRLFVFE